MKNVGVAITTHGAAVIEVAHKDEDDVVTAIHVMPRSIDAVADLIEDLDDSEPADTQFIIDAEGTGSALWALVGAEPTHMHVLTAAEEAKRDRWRLYEKHSFERQELVNALVVAMRSGAETLHFEADLDNFDTLATALGHYEQQVREDGLVGTELVVALALAILPRPRRTSHRAMLV